MLKLILLHSADNVLIVRSSIHPGDIEIIENHQVTFGYEISIGHKIAFRPIKKGDIIIKYGVPIGSATTDIQTGEHIHLHNMKSDYLPTYTLDKEFI
jgi:hypothetical protein